MLFYVFNPEDETRLEVREITLKFFKFIGFNESQIALIPASDFQWEDEKLYFRPNTNLKEKLREMATPIFTDDCFGLARQVLHISVIEMTDGNSFYSEIRKFFGYSTPNCNSEMSIYIWKNSTKEST